MATGIRDKVAILGMGCSKFGERWDMGADDLLVEAYEECIKDAGIEKKQIQAAWLGTCFPEISVGQSALPLSISLRLPNIPVTRVENFCASGTEGPMISAWLPAWRSSRTPGTADCLSSGQTRDPGVS
jgi:acetyl-CoA C-acetyltransferase